MNHKRYAFLLVLVSVVIAITLAIQLYWVFKNYEESRRQLDRDIQTSFDLTVEDYFTASAKRNTIGFLSENGQLPAGRIDSLINNISSITAKPRSATLQRFPATDSLFLLQKDTLGLSQLNNIKNIQKVEIFSGLDQDTNAFKKTPNFNINRFLGKKDSANGKESARITDISFNDDAFTGKVVGTDKRIVISYSTNVVDLEVIDSLMNIALEKNEIQIEKGFKYNNGKSDFEIGDLTGDQRVISTSPQLYKDTKLEMFYSGLETTLLKRNLAGMSLSFLLISGVIFCLFHLLHVINKQKQLSLIKNDLISNITHEFKTPIATASAALEGIQNFTGGDKEKSDRYLNVGREQLSKLNLMVEKLLETALIDSEKLALQKTRFNLAHLVKESVDMYNSATDKSIELQMTNQPLYYYGDEFHIENAFNNLLDNAIKYGGEVIKVTAVNSADTIQISVSDNGNLLKSKDAKYIFEKFYRIPQGDKHNIKGYGIGLFYTKAIIEKHGGNIEVSLDPTTFKIQLFHV